MAAISLIFTYLWLQEMRKSILKAFASRADGVPDIFNLDINKKLIANRLTPAILDSYILRKNSPVFIFR